MLFKSKKNLLLVGAISILLYANILHAEDCGVLRYLANKSNGVVITDNTCKMIDDIALGSKFNLMPGARLWFKSQIDVDAKATQGICQNRSSMPVSISVGSDKLPWIKPSGLANCGSWVDNKMNCDDSNGGQSALSCVIATINSDARPKGFEERTTSVRMRSLPAIDGPDKIKSLQSSAEIQKAQIISAMQADVGLCKAVDHTDAPIKITWLVEANGQVNKIIPIADGSGVQDYADKSLIDCLSAVIKVFPYVQSSQAVWLSNQF